MGKFWILADKEELTPGAGVLMVSGTIDGTMELSRVLSVLLQTFPPECKLLAYVLDELSKSFSLLTQFLKQFMEHKLLLILDFRDILFRLANVQFI